MINTVLFDLDGTLLRMDHDAFVHKYFAIAVDQAVAFGLDKALFSHALMMGTQAMLNNDGNKTNESVFWDTFLHQMPISRDCAHKFFDDFYQHRFVELQTVTGCDPNAKRCVRILQKKGYRVLLATNPVFPRFVVQQRLQWAGLELCDFEYVTSFENSCYCKPSPSYYTMIARQNDLVANRCQMVGNDMRDDLAAIKAGMHVFLVTDCLLNGTVEEKSKIPSGSLKEYLHRIWDWPSLC